MQNKALNDMLIKECYKKYQKRYNLTLPEIQKINYYYDDEVSANFNVDDLYNKRYILNVNYELLSCNKKYIKQNLFHEFTHLTDSLDFLDKNFKEFKNVMCSYSEFHSAKREMVERIEEIEDDNITLDSQVEYEDGKRTIKDIIDIDFNLMEEDLDMMSKNNDEDNFFYRTNRIYYFYGHISTLNSFNINYNINLNNIPECFREQILVVQDSLLNDNIEIDNILKSYLDLQEKIMYKCIENMKEQISLQ